MSPGPASGPRYERRPSSSGVSLRGMRERSGATSAVAGWLMKSIASGVIGGVGSHETSVGAKLDERRWPGHDRPVQARDAKSAGNDFAQPQWVRPTDLEGLVGRLIGHERIRYQARDVVDEHRSQQLPTRVGQRHGLQLSSKAQEAVERHVARPINPCWSHDGVRDVARSDGGFGAPLGTKPVPLRVRGRTCARDVHEIADISRHGGVD